MLEKFKNILLKANLEGIPIPLLRDNGKGSSTLTMFWLSYLLSVLLLAGKITKVVGDVDYSNVLWLLGMSGSFYLGRKLQGSGKNMVLEGEKKDA